MGSTPVFLTITSPTNQTPTTLTETASWITLGAIVTVTFAQVSPAPTLSYQVLDDGSLELLAPGAITSTAANSQFTAPTSLGPTTTTLIPPSVTSSTVPSTVTSSPIQSTALSNAGLSSGAKAAVGVGVVFGVIGISALLGVIHLLRRRKQESTMNNKENRNNVDHQWGKFELPSTERQMAELPDTHGRVEIEAAPAELAHAELAAEERPLEMDGRD